SANFQEIPIDVLRPSRRLRARAQRISAKPPSAKRTLLPPPKLSAPRSPRRNTIPRTIKTTPPHAPGFGSANTRDSHRIFFLEGIGGTKFGVFHERALPSPAPSRVK